MTKPNKHDGKRKDDHRRSRNDDRDRDRDRRGGGSHSHERSERGGNHRDRDNSHGHGRGNNRDDDRRGHSSNSRGYGGRNDSDQGNRNRGNWNPRGGNNYPKFDRNREDSSSSQGRGGYYGGPPIYTGGPASGPVPFLIPREPPVPWGLLPGPPILPQAQSYWGQNPYASFDRPVGVPPQEDREHRRDASYDDRGRKRDRDYPNDRHHSRDSDSRRHSSGNSDERGAWGGSSKRARVEDEMWKQRQEEQRIAVVRQDPNKIFIEDVNLAPEFAFRLDSRPSNRHLSYYTLNLNNASRFEPEYRRDDVYGATEEELSNLPFRSKFSRCIRPVGIDEDGNPVDDDGNILDEDGQPVRTTSTSITVTETGVKKEKAKRKDIIRSAVNYISMEGQTGKSNAVSKIVGQPQKQLSVRDRVEAFNVELRQKPNDIELWRKFVRFQDQVLEQELEEMGVSHGTEGKRPKGKFSKKTVAEKRIAIIEKAIESNPKNLDLHLDRMEILYELYKPRYVLGEWKKLVTLHQQLGSFWIEYLLFSSTQLQLYSSSALLGVYEKCFQKFRLMFNPNYPAFQRPEKFPLLIADLFAGLTLILRNSGLMEKAISFHQAQLEINFHFPRAMLDDKAEWDAIMSLFALFWDAGTLRYGETEAPGWCRVVQDKVEIIKRPSEVEKLAIEWEDSYFDHFSTSEQDKKPTTAEHWISIESLRSTSQWLPWRENYAGSDNCDDSQRMVVCTELAPMLTLLSPADGPHLSAFDRQAYYYRSVMNFLLTLRDDFLPRTQTLDTILSSFFPLSLTSMQTLMSEINYWKTYLSLYGIEEKAGKTDVPEGFNIPDYVTCNPKYASAETKETEDKEQSNNLEENLPADIKTKRDELVASNYIQYNSLLLNVVENSLQFLDSKFASLVAQAYIRFQQRSTFYSNDAHKNLMKTAKNLLQNEKLRNSLPLYGEIAMLEYFGSKNIGKCSDILVKTINSASAVLRTASESNGEVDVQANWETVAELAKLYRLLAELYVKDKPLLSIRILTALGNDFQAVEIVDDPKPLTKNEMLISRRRFEKVLISLVPTDDVKEKFYAEKWDGSKFIEYLLQQTSLVVEWISTYGLFTYLSEGFDECSDVFANCLKHITSVPVLHRSTKYSAVPVATSHFREQLFVRWCHIGILEVSKNPMQNAKLRGVLNEALQEFPASPPMLMLFCEVEKQSSIAGKIWRLMSGAIKNETGIISLHWASLFMSLSLARKIEDMKHDEEVGLPVFGLGGPAVPPDTIFHKLDAVLTTAEQNTATRSCPLIWRLHFNLTAIRAQNSGLAKDKQAAKGMFYDAIRFCPSVKVLYMDALRFFPDMMKEVLDLMNEKQLSIRLPAEELNVLLEKEESDQDGNDSDAGPDTEMNEDEEKKSGDDEPEVIELDSSIEIVETNNSTGLEKQDAEDCGSVSEGEIID